MQQTNEKLDAWNAMADLAEPLADECERLTRERDEAREKELHMLHAANEIGQKLEAAEAEVERLNDWADKFSDAQLKERALADATIKEKMGEIQTLRARVAELEAEMERLFAATQ